MKEFQAARYAEIVRFKNGYKYQLVAPYRYDTGITRMGSVGLMLALDDDGWLHIQEGYAWDGPSGPALDTQSFMRASLVHDALYQMMRTRLLPQRYRDVADKIMHKICLEAGMPRWRAWYTYHAVRFFAGDAADPKNAKPVLTAP